MLPLMVVKPENYEKAALEYCNLLIVSSFPAQSY